MRRKIILLPLVIAVLFLLWSCTEENGVGPGPVETAVCRGAEGPAYEGSLGDSVVWGPEDGPRVLTASASAGDIVLEPGTVVCAAEGATLTVARLEGPAPGAEPAVLTALDPESPWGGVVLRGPAELRDITIEHAERGLKGPWGQPGPPVLIDRVHVRQIHGTGVSVSGGRMRNSVVDTACIGVRDGCAAVGLSAWGSFVFEDIVVRGSGGRGVAAGRYARIELLGGRIEGSAGIGLHLTGIRGNVDSVVAEPMVITGGGSYPADIPFAFVSELLPDEKATRDWTGNAHDILIVRGWGRESAVDTVRTVLPWKATVVVQSDSELRLEPGARLEVTSDQNRAALTADSGRIVARGTATKPVVVTGPGILGVPFIRLRGAPSQPSVFEHVIMRDIGLEASDGHAVKLEDVQATRSRFRLAAAGSRITRALVESGRGFGVALDTPDVHLDRTAVLGTYDGPGVRISAADVSLAHCTLADGDADGALVTEATAVTIRDCNIERNAGPGIRNTSTQPVDARDNWWGDPAGPAGPDGDGVEGDVLATDPRAAPVPLDLLPAVSRLTLTPADRSITAGDTVHFSVTMTDENGVSRPTENVLWRFSDPDVAGSDLDGAGVVIGFGAGEATVAALAPSDTTVRAPATLVVTGDGPTIRWRRTDTGYDKWITSLWGASPNDVFAAALVGRIFHYDGTGWTSVYDANSTGTHFYDLHGRVGDDVYAVGTNVILHYDGDAWQDIGTPAPADYINVWIAPTGELHVGSRPLPTEEGPDRIWRRVAGQWEDISPETDDDFTLLGGCSADEVYASGPDGLMRWNGKAWTDVAGRRFETAWVGEEALYGIERGDLYRFDFETRQVSPVDAGTDRALSAIDGSGSGILAVGNGRTMRFFDGSDWSLSWAGATAPGSRYNAVWVGDGVALVAGFTGHWSEAANGVVLMGRF